MTATAHRLTTVLTLLLCLAPAVWAQDAVYLSDAYNGLIVRCVQGWGDLGLDTAAVPQDGRPGSTLRHGETTYEKGLGHHAPGELVFDLSTGAYAAFAAQAGVHWQGGGKGSVTFQVFVDGEKRFEAGPLTDSDPPVSIRVPLAGAAELKLTALDAGDGIACDMADWANARLECDPDAVHFGAPEVLLDGRPAPAPSMDVCGFALIAAADGPQLAMLGPGAALASLREGERVAIRVPAFNVPEDAHVTADARVERGAAGIEAAFDGDAIRLSLRAENAQAVVRIDALRVDAAETAHTLRFLPRPSRDPGSPPRTLPELRPAIAQALIAWDWRMQDGVGTAREPVAWLQAGAQTLERGRQLLEHLQRSGARLAVEERELEQLEAEQAAMPANAEAWWRRVHAWRRRVVFSDAARRIGPLVFAKRVPAYSSHQLTQYYGRCARRGGGLFVLDEPGASMAARPLAPDALPPGSWMQPEVSYDADRILFAYCEVPFDPVDAAREKAFGRRHHLYEMRPDGTGLRQLTDGPYDDFSPKELPNGDLLFISTRRGGYHRCGRGPCYVYTLAVAAPDGSNPRTVSFHETHEWDPSVLADGRVIYTRWDYVDRNAVHYQHLWTARPDGSAPAIYFGNNTFNPVGIWEARQVPDSPLVMATAAAHHAMTAGSIILLDTTRGVDGPGPITRLTPDAPFPESETYVLPNNWHAPGSPKTYDTPVEARRWPGHCYRSPYPLSETRFLAAYSFDSLLGEPTGNRPNMFGLYLVDAFGNKELVYRDLNIASLWPVPLRPRPRPPALPSANDPLLAGKGVFFLQNVYESAPAIPHGAVKALRIVQVLPKTTPHANQPRVGLANASPGKQVLGTVPVEPDGSACFEAPSGVALGFQALDGLGRAIQTMRSITYLQPGERTSCVGCHEPRLSAPPWDARPAALTRRPSTITPAPDGSKPLSYPILVQPVLDAHCVSCHGGVKPAGPEGSPIVLTSEPEGAFSKSYNALAKRVPFSSWGGLEENGEPLTQPGRFGARASSLMTMLLEGHHDVALEREDLDRLTTWMDANALFYGTFDPDGQARQQRGERIEGPALE